MSPWKQITCPDCSGSGHIKTSIQEKDPTRPGQYRYVIVSITCPLCKGAKTITISVEEDKKE